MKIITSLKCESAQATVELAIMFPVVLIIALIAYNALSFFTLCATFDRVFNQSVITRCSSPAYGEGLGNMRQYVENDIQDMLMSNNTEAAINIESVSGGMIKFTGELNMKPSLFGMSMKDSIFGCTIYPIKHSKEFIIESYKPGVIF